MPSATEACCGIGRETIEAVHDNEQLIDRPCAYLGEKLTYLTNMERCQSLGGYPCDHIGPFHDWHNHEQVNEDCIDDYRASNSWLWDNVWHWTVSAFVGLFYRLSSCLI